MSEKLTIKTSEEEDFSVIHLIGRVDTNTSPEFESAYQKLLSEGKKKIMIDMKECDYISSAGLRVIISLQKN